jgi:hypothetical protein
MRETNDGWESQQGSKVQNPQSRGMGVNSAVWVLERTRHEGQGSSPRPERPVNLSLVLAPDVRNCQRKTKPRVEKKDLLGTRLQGCYSWVQSAAVWLKWVVGFIGGAKPWGRERVFGLQLSVKTR